jgi:hypothetical protein
MRLAGTTIWFGLFGGDEPPIDKKAPGCLVAAEGFCLSGGFWIIGELRRCSEGLVGLDLGGVLLGGFS